MAYWSLFRPIKTFGELKEQLGKQYSGDALWQKVTEAAKKNTNQNAVGCFVAGTVVHTRDGLRPIEQIQVGDYVLSRPESGNGETAYKRVVNTFEFDGKETWFVSWQDVSLVRRLRTDVTPEQYLEAHGKSFVVITPNHPFWVVSREEWIDNLYMEHYRYWPPYPERQWVWADRLVPGMTLLLADGRVVTVSGSYRVYRSDKDLQGWINESGDGLGVTINFANQQARSHVGVHDWSLYDAQLTDQRSRPAGYIENPNDSFADDFPPDEPAPHSWYLSKVYNLEVEGYHTYFVDKLGIWVHNTHCGKNESEILAENSKTYNSRLAFHHYLRTLPDDQLTGVRVVRDASYDPDEPDK